MTNPDKRQVESVVVRLLHHKLTDRARQAIRQGLFEEAHEASGVAHGAELSDDGLFTVHEEECLGVCDFAPAVQIRRAIGPSAS